jgi:hypothetical protein
MSIKVTIPNLPATLAGVRAATNRIELAAQFGVNMVSNAVLRQAVKNANTGHHKPGEGHIPGTGPGPNTATTSLRDSIRAERRKGLATYEMIVAPTVVYARAVELGNPRWKSGVRYPYMAPAAREVGARAQQIFIEAFRSKLRG